MYTGRKETHLVAVNARTGKVISQYGLPSAPFMQPRCYASKDQLDELDDECDVSPEDHDVIMIGKTSSLYNRPC